jgi:hypothetical protein
MLLAGMSAALGVGKAIMDIRQTNQQAGATAEAANKAVAIDYQILARRQSEINEQHASEAMERQRVGLKERSKIQVAMGESGVLGNSPLREINDSFLQAGYDTSRIEQNREININRTQDMALQSYSQAQGRVNQAKASAVNPFLSILKIGMAGASGYMQGAAAGNTLFPGGSSGGFDFTGSSSALNRLKLSDGLS